MDPGGAEPYPDPTLDSLRLNRIRNFPGMYVLRDRLITAEIWDFVLSRETCYFVNKRLKTRKSEFSAVSNGVEPNAELYSDVRIYNYDF